MSPLVNTEVSLLAAVCEKRDKSHLGQEAPWQVTRSLKQRGEVHSLSIPSHLSDRVEHLEQTSSSEDQAPHLRLRVSPLSLLSRVVVDSLAWQSRDKTVQ